MQGPTQGHGFVDLFFACRELPKLDLLSPSDPVIVVHSFTSGIWTELGRTEWIKDNANPNFVKSIRVNYAFEIDNPLRATVYDMDDERLPVEQQDYIGEYHFRLADLLSARGQKLRQNLKKKHGEPTKGVIQIRGEVVKQSNVQLKFRMSASGLDKMRFFGSNAPYFTISRQNEDESYQVVHKSEVLSGNNPNWSPFQINLQTLCNSETARLIRVEVFDFYSSTQSTSIGSFEVPASELMKKGTFSIIKNSRRNQPNAKRSGVFNIVDFDQYTEYSFMDYITGGYEISVMFCIDFTGSNLDPRQPNSLHHLNPSVMNGYQYAIHSIGNVVAPYDSDQMFPVFGFGGCFPPNAPVSHLFPLNGNPSYPEVQGIPGVMGLYNNCVVNCKLFGPTNFAPSINYAVQLARKAVSEEQRKYIILLILTDGEISDMNDTVDAIVDASTLPISIIIVGIGNATFDNMDTLDGDIEPLRNSRGRLADRDIVQFVPLNKLPPNDLNALAKHTLAEVPTQFVSYMTKNRIPPPQPTQLLDSFQ